MGMGSAHPTANGDCNLIIFSEVPAGRRIREPVQYKWVEAGEGATSDFSVTSVKLHTVANNVIVCGYTPDNASRRGVLELSAWAD
jgi:hypothetical protein